MSRAFRPAGQLSIACTAVVLPHLLVSLVHGYAHTQLGVGLSTWQQLYVLFVIMIGPLVALVLVWTRQTRSAFVVLTISMAGSFIFGAYYHYVEVSPDHVLHLPPGDSQGLFRLTALLLIVTEAFGIIVAFLGLRAMRHSTYERHSQYRNGLGR